MSLESISKRLVFEPRTETGTEHFARLDSGPVRIFKLIVSTTEKMLNNIKVVIRRKPENLIPNPLPHKREMPASFFIYYYCYYYYFYYYFLSYTDGHTQGQRKLWPGFDQTSVDKSRCFLTLIILMLMIFAVLVCYLIKQGRKGLKNSGVNGTRNPDLRDAFAVPQQLSYKTNCELVIYISQW